MFPVCLGMNIDVIVWGFMRARNNSSWVVETTLKKIFIFGCLFYFVLFFLSCQPGQLHRATKKYILKKKKHSEALEGAPSHIRPLRSFIWARRRGGNLEGTYFLLSHGSRCQLSHTDIHHNTAAEAEQVEVHGGENMWKSKPQIEMLNKWMDGWKNGRSGISVYLQKHTQDLSSVHHRTTLCAPNFPIDYLDAVEIFLLRSQNALKQTSDPVRACSLLT